VLLEAGGQSRGLGRAAVHYWRRMIYTVVSFSPNGQGIILPACHAVERRLSFESALIIDIFKTYSSHGFKEG